MIAVTKHIIRAAQMMGRTRFILIVIGLCLGACADTHAPHTSGGASAAEMAALAISGTDRLYTTECVVRKIITYDDVVKVRGNVFSRDFDIKVPQPERKILIPLEARIKAYVDFSNFTEKNVSIDSSYVRITLPDPEIELTSTKIDHAGVIQYVELGRKRFSQQEITEFANQGREAILKAVPRETLIARAREHAYNTIVPIIENMGYDPDRITVEFRSDLDLDKVYRPLHDFKIKD